MTFSGKICDLKLWSLILMLTTNMRDMSNKNAPSLSFQNLVYPTEWENTREGFLTGHHLSPHVGYLQDSASLQQNETHQHHSYWFLSNSQEFSYQD